MNCVEFRSEFSVALIDLYTFHNYLITHTDQIKNIQVKIDSRAHHFNQLKTIYCTIINPSSYNFVNIRVKQFVCVCASQLFVILKMCQLIEHK